MTGRTMLALAAPPTGGHDLYLDLDGQIAAVHDAEAVGQHARCRLMTYRGEWFLDTSAGVPWLDRILGHRVDLTLAESVIKAELRNTDGVTGISSFDLRFRAATRALDLVSADLETAYDATADLRTPRAPTEATIIVAEDGDWLAFDDGGPLLGEG